jgi:two-component system OmpR family response regulator
MRILLIEDEPVLGEAVATHLKRSNHAVDWVQRLDDAEAALRAVDYGLILLDLHLPDGRGLDLLRKLRKADDRRPVIILTDATRSATASRASTPGPTTISSNRSILMS